MLDNQPIPIDLLPFKEHLKTRLKGEKTEVWDPIRKRWLILLPEETVRQLFIQYLLKTQKISPNLIGIEKELEINQLSRRFDLVVYDKDISPLILFELKAPTIPISNKVFDQISLYNQKLNVAYLVVSNGLQTYACQMDYEDQTIIFLTHFPKTNTI